ncbi:MAG: hypothetical protein R3F34_10965 [Planctomycetota bacterium]
MQVRTLAAALENALHVGGDSWSAALDRAIRTEILIVALDDPSRPATLAELASVLERRAYGGPVARALAEIVADLARRTPSLELEVLASS